MVKKKVRKVPPIPKGAPSGEKMKKNPWFRKRVEIGNAPGWGWIPINWRGWIALILLIGLNVFAANYFRLNKLVLENWISFGVVFLLSLFVFIMIAQRKTRGVKAK